MLRESLQRVGFVFRALTQRKLDLLDQMELDHLRMEFNFFQWNLAQDQKRREEILNHLQREVLLHFQVMEAVFFPACEKIPELRVFILEEQREQKKIRALLSKTSFKTPVRSSSRPTARSQARSPRSSALSPTLSPRKFEILFEQLKTLMKAHIAQEENVLFPQIRTLMKPTLLLKLGREYRIEKRGKTERIAT